MNPKFNPSCKCGFCGSPVPSHMGYCNLACRDGAKLARRKSREKGNIPVAQTTPSKPFPDSSPETLTFVSEQILSGNLPSPQFFENGNEASSWQVPSGLYWEVLVSGMGVLTKL